VWPLIADFSAISTPFDDFVRIKQACKSPPAISVLIYSLVFLALSNLPRQAEWSVRTFLFFCFVESVSADQVQDATFVIVLLQAGIRITVSNPSSGPSEHSSSNAIALMMPTPAVLWHAKSATISHNLCVD
jgi:hypothetical protein